MHADIAPLRAPARPCAPSTPSSPTSPMILSAGCPPRRRIRSYTRHSSSAINAGTSARRLRPRFCTSVYASRIIKRAATSARNAVGSSITAIASGMRSAASARVSPNVMGGVYSQSYMGLVERPLE